MHTIGVVSAIEGTVRMIVHDLKHKCYFHIGCTLGGVFIVSGFVESICSSNKAHELWHTYNHNGLALGHKVLIILKQYRWLSQVQANLTFSVDNCSSRFNFLPNAFLFPRYNLYSSKLEDMQRSASHRYFSHGYNKYYLWPLRRRSYHMELLPNLYGTPCWVMNSVMLSQSHSYLTGFIEYTNVVYLHVSSFNRTGPSILSVAFVNPNPIVENIYDCLANGLNVLPDNRNDEPYIYVTTSPMEVFSMRVYNAKIRVNLHCLIFGGSFHIKFEPTQDTENTCFSEIGGYMYDAVNPIIPQGICGDVLVQTVKLAVRFLSLQRPLKDDKCCYYDVLLINRNCTTTVSVYQPTTHHNRVGYVVQRWYTKGKGNVRLFWRGICRYEYYFDSRSESYITTCMDMVVAIKSLCDMRLTYRASLIDEDLSGNSHTVESNGYQKSLCLSNTCYTVPTGGAKLSWTDAQQMCKNQNSSLASINTAEDWKLITRNALISGKRVNITLLPVSGVQIFYIGYRTKVSEGTVFSKILL